MTDYRQAARDSAKRYRIDQIIFERQIQEESGFDPNAHNAKSGADGIAQIVPSQHPTMRGRTRDALASLDYAAQYDQSNLTRYRGNLVKMLAAYNWGPGNVDKWNGQRNTLPAETRTYLNDILGPDWQPATGDEPEQRGGGEGDAAPGGTTINLGATFAPLAEKMAEKGWTWADIGWSVAFGAAACWLAMAGITALTRGASQTPLMKGPVDLGQKIARAVPGPQQIASTAGQLVPPATATRVDITVPRSAAAGGQGSTRGTASSAAKAVAGGIKRATADAASGAIADGVIDA